MWNLNRRKFLGGGLVGLILGLLGRKAEAKPAPLPYPKGPFWWKVHFKLSNYSETFNALVYAEGNENGEPDYHEIWSVLALSIKHRGPLGIEILDDAVILPFRGLNDVSHREFYAAEIVMDCTQAKDEIKLLKNIFGTTDSTIHRVRCA